MVPDKGSPIHINVSQNDDKCRTFIFKLYSSDGSWTAPASATSTIEGRKDDGKFFSFACTYSNGEVTVIVQQQMVVVAGKVRCKIKLVSGAETIESAPFYFVVNPKSMPVNADMSKSDVVDAVAKATQKIVDQVAGSIPQDYVKLNEDVSGLKSDINQLNKNGMGVYFPVWELGDYDISGKTDNANRVRSKELVYLNAGTYTLIAETKTTIITYYDSDFSGGANIVWLEGPGTIEFTVTVRNYIGIISEKIGENAPTKTYAIVPSYISKNFEKLSSDIEQNGTKIEETNSKVEVNISDIQACNNNIHKAKNKLTVLSEDGKIAFFPTWTDGRYDNNGIDDENKNYVRNTSLVHLDAGTYKVVCESNTFVVSYESENIKDGVALLWNATGEQEITVTIRNYVGIYALKIDGEKPSETWIELPSYISKNFEKLSSDIEQNGTKIEETNSKVEGNASDIQACSNSIHEVKDKLTYNSGVFNAIIEGVTKNPQTNVYQGLQVGSKFELLTNDIYTYTMCVNNVEVGRTYRLKARVTSKSHFIFFIDSSGILIKKDGYNDSDTAQTLIDYCVIVPEKAAQMYVLSLSSVDILIDIYNPYTVKNRQNNLQNHAHGIYCIMQYNVGDWYEGQFREEDDSGSIPADEKIYSDYIEMHTKIFERYGADFCLINEDARSMCLNRHDDSRAFLGQWYSHLEYGLLQEQRYTNVYNTIASNISLEDVQVIHFSDTDSNTSRNLLKGYAYLNGKKVCIVNTHLSANSKIGKKNCVELLNFVKDEPYLILAGDFNLSLENDEEVRAFETAGFKISHGSETFNDFTYGHGDLIVTTQNITIKSVFSDRIKGESECCKYIDHLPTIAYLEIF